MQFPVKNKEKQGDTREADGDLRRRGRGRMHEAAPSNKKEEKVFPETWFHLS